MAIFSSTIWAGSATAIALLSVGGAAYWMGTHHGRDAAVQGSYKAFGGQLSYDFAKELMNRGDNVQRFCRVPQYFSFRIKLNVAKRIRL